MTFMIRFVVFATNPATKIIFGAHIIILVWVPTIILFHIFLARLG